jgi:hypothetical protein
MRPVLVDRLVFGTASPTELYPIGTRPRSPMKHVNARTVLANDPTWGRRVRLLCNRGNGERKDGMKRICLVASRRKCRSCWFVRTSPGGDPWGA